MWSANDLSSYGTGSAGEKLDSVGASANPWLTDLSSYNTEGTAGKALKDAKASATAAQSNTDTLEASVDAIKDVTDNLPTAANIADAVRVELEPELTRVMQIPTSGTGLTPTQETMLLELYALMGLDPAKPLIVTKTSRTAGIEIQQSITSDSNMSTVTRV